MTSFTRPILALVCAATLAVTVRAAVPTVRPEEVGLSSERLRRVTELMQRQIDAKTFSGAVTLIARNGRIAQFEAQGLMDLESKKPMPKDGLSVQVVMDPVAADRVAVDRRIGAVTGGHNPRR